MMKRIYTAVMAALMAPPALAADIGDEVRRGVYQADDYNGGYFEIGARVECGHASLKYHHDIHGSSRTECEPGWTSGFEYRYKRFFAEASSHSRDGLNIGLNLWRSQGWSVDFLAASVSGSITIASNVERDSEAAGISESQRNYLIANRDNWYVGTGARVTRYFDNYIAQFRLVTDIHGGNGLTSTARLGRAWQVRNWNFHGVASIYYRSAKTSQYLYGVSELEQTEKYPAHRPGPSFDTSLEVGLSYPLTEHWVFRSTAYFIPVPVEVQDSPMINNDWFSSIKTTISYVF